MNFKTLVIKLGYSNLLVLFWTKAKEVINPIDMYIVGWVGSSPILSAQWFLGRSCQKKFMRSNGFGVILSNTVRGLYLREVKNYYTYDQISKMPSHDEYVWKD